MIDTIKIKELLECIQNCSSEKYISFIKDLDLKIEDFIGRINFSEKKYTRTCISKTKDFELILLAWNTGQKAAIHNHEDSIGFIYVLQGEIKEVKYKRNTKTGILEKLSSAKYKKNDVSLTTKDEHCFHSIENISNEKTLTLHLYKTPIDSCLVLDNKTNKIVKKDLVYDFE